MKRILPIPRDARRTPVVVGYTLGRGVTQTTQGFIVRRVLVEVHAWEAWRDGEGLLLRVYCKNRGEHQRN